MIKDYSFFEGLLHFLELCVVLSIAYLTVRSLKNAKGRGHGNEALEEEVRRRWGDQ